LHPSVPRFDGRCTGFDEARVDAGVDGVTGIERIF
jgi:hypothetical protein